MRKFLTSSLAAVTFAGAVLATATPAAAQHRYYRRHHHHGGGDAAAAAIIAGVAGLAIGSALSSDGRHSTRYRSYYDDSYYGGSGYAYDPRYDSYYGGGYYAPPRRVYRTCTRTERFWDPYVGSYVTVKRRYAC